MFPLQWAEVEFQANSKWQILSFLNAFIKKLKCKERILMRKVLARSCFNFPPRQSNLIKLIEKFIASALLIELMPFKVLLLGIVFSTSQTIL